MLSVNISLYPQVMWEWIESRWDTQVSGNWLAFSEALFWPKFWGKNLVQENVLKWMTYIVIHASKGYTFKGFLLPSKGFLAASRRECLFDLYRFFFPFISLDNSRQPLKTKCVVLTLPLPSTSTPCSILHMEFFGLFYLWVRRHTNGDVMWLINCALWLLECQCVTFKECIQMEVKISK